MMNIVNLFSYLMQTMTNPKLGWVAHSSLGGHNIEVGTSRDFIDPYPVSSSTLFSYFNLFEENSEEERDIIF